MPGSSGTVGPVSYTLEVLQSAWQSVRRLVRSPSHSRRFEARYNLARRSMLLSAIAVAVIVALMLLFDVSVVKFMPARGTASLWPVRIFTDFAKSSYVLLLLAAILGALVAIAPRLRGVSRHVLAAFGIRIQYLFFSVFIAVLAGEIAKAIVGRGRPFVGGDANAFNFAPFTRTEAFASFPSGHAVTAFALAFAVSSLWPRLSATMWSFAVLICISRVVLLAHHPSDVIAGALIGAVGAMAVRYWFAARRLGFKVRSNGAIEPLQGPTFSALKRVAREAFAP